MSTLKVTALKNPSSSANNIVLNTDGSISGISSSGTITANNLVINDGGGVGPTVDIKGGGTSTDSPASNEQTLFLRTRNGTTSLSTGIGFWGTFENFPSDTGARRAADIRAGFNGGTWGNEYISFHVGVGTGVVSNDSAAMTTERLRITKTAMIANGEVRATDYTVGTSGKLASNNYLQSQLSGGGGIEIVAAGRFTSAGATTKASNLSCTRTTTGSYTLTFGTARPTSTYIIQGQIIEPSSTSDDVKIHVLDGSQTTSSFQVRIYEGDNGGTADVLRDRNFYITVVDF